MEQERDTTRFSNFNSRLLLDRFDRDVRDGVNDEGTKSCLYSFMNRYFHNGGNIYEIYKYVESRPNLAFLKRASTIYPALFRLISDHELPETASPGSLLSYLAYGEVLARSGYAGVALHGTAAHQYAQLAYIATREPSILAPGINVVQNILMKQNKALFFADAAQGDIMLIIEGQADAIPVRDQVAGLRHYAVALRYFGVMDIECHSPRTAREIFAVCTKTIRENDVPELEPFTGLLDASTLLLDVTSGVDEVRTALHPILESAPDVQSGRKLIRRILLAKDQSLRASDYQNQPRDTREFGVFGKENILNLARKVPEFQTWLKDGGWAEVDFVEVG